MLTIRVLGELSVETDGEPVDLPARARELLAWLAVHPGPHDRARVAAVFWPDVTDEAARNNLRQTAWALRRSLGDAGSLISSSRVTIGLRRDDEVNVDLWDQQQALFDGDIDRALTHDGALLPDAYAEWAEQARADHQRALAESLDRAAWRAEETSDHDKAVELTQRLVQIDPYSEHAHRDLMRRLASAGDRAQALTIHAQFAAKLRDELGVAPSAVTERVAARLRAVDEFAPARVAPLTNVEHRFVGRHPELTALRAAWAQARNGPARCVVVAGEGGIGKSRLVHELTALAVGDGALVLSGRATEETLVPYQPWVEALRRCILNVPDAVVAEIATVDLSELNLLVPELARRTAQPAATSATPSITDRYRMFDAVARLLALLARHLPVVIVLDDMHWADQSTLLLLRHVMEATSELPLLVVITYRDNDPRAAQLKGSLAELRSTRVTRHVLRGLESDAIAELVADLMGDSPPGKLLEILHHRTGGNPYFVVEVVRDLADSGALVVRDGSWVWSLADARVVIPDAITQIIERRLRQLPPAARAVLEVAAVAGFQFSTDIVHDVAGQSPPALLDMLDASVAAGLLDELPGEPGRYRFGHPLAWETLYHGLTANRRAHLHTHVASAIEALRDMQQPDAAVELARHLLHTPKLDQDRTLRLAAVAAERLIAVRAYDEAVELCETALARVPQGDNELRRALFTQRGIAIGTITSEWLHPGEVPIVKVADRPARQEK